MLVQDDVNRTTNEILQEEQVQLYIDIIEKELSVEDTKNSNSFSSQGIFKNNDEENDFFERHHRSETLRSETTVDIEIELEKILKRNEEQMESEEVVTKILFLF
jgi:hypothetical protein